VGWIFLILGVLVVAGTLSKEGRRQLTQGQRIGGFAFGVVFLLIGLAYLFPAPQPPQQPQTAQQTQQTEPTQPTAPTEAPKPEEPSNPPPTLPGLAWVDITLNLEKEPYGFRFTMEPSNVIPGVKYHRAVKVDPDTGAEMWVEIATYGDKVLHYEVSVSGLNAEPTASWLLPYLATAPFDGNPQLESKAWAEKALGQVRQGAPLERRVGEAVFVLLGNPPTSYTLEVSHRDYESWSQHLR
jgi:hypothetical protein